MRLLVAFGITVAVVVAAPRPALAANASKPRVPVVWTAAPCIEVVDRSQTPVLHLDYSVASEELGELTMDEVADSRHHQFFAFSAQRFEAGPPTWITWADIDRAALVDPMVEADAIDPEDVLETTSRWDDSEWVRITADDMRVPISFDQAMMGVDWDLSSVAPGTWLVKGYTWEPTKNLWSTRWGAVKLIADASQADAAGPSVILLPESAVLQTGVEHVPAGCIDAPAGSTLTLEYGRIEGSLEPNWQVAHEDVEVDSGELAIGVELPSDLAGASVLLRATITDPQGASYTAYSPIALAVMPGPETDDGDDGGCTIAADRVGLPWWLVLLTLGLHRRRCGANLRR